MERDHKRDFQRGRTPSWRITRFPGQTSHVLATPCFTALALKRCCSRKDSQQSLLLCMCVLKKPKPDPRVIGPFPVPFPGHCDCCLVTRALVFLCCLQFSCRRRLSGGLATAICRCSLRRSLFLCSHSGRNVVSEEGDVRITCVNPTGGSVPKGVQIWTVV